ncbi:MAG TPA: hypothetical protein VEY51_04275, partial [Chondromyces sp.]|nr:hypothetical protein [Chondromyces sp.]
EIFNHDKMFFVVNACDLASSENEIAEVVRHVEKNLLTCGIRNPQIFPISSHIAIMAHKFGKGQLSENEEKRYIKLTNSHAPLKKEDGLEFAGLQVFEEAFYPFILEDLAGVVIHSAQSDAEKSKTMLREWVMLQEKEESEKVKLVKEMEEIQKNALSLLESLEFSMEIDLFKQELNELFYYIQQRVFYRYRDEFRNVFSPHVLKQEDEFASQLLRCTNEVIRFTAKDLAQEVRATSFRMEVYIQKAIQNIYQQLEAQLKELSPGFALRQGEQPKFDKLPIEEGLQEIKASLLKEKFQEYSSGSDFFIERKVFKLRDELEHVLRQPAKDYLLEKEEKMQHEYLPIFEKGLKNAKQDVIHQADSYCRQQIRVLMEKSGPETYRNALNTLKELLAGM